MLIEIKAKATREIDGKLRKRTETYLMDKEFFANAEYALSVYNQDLISSSTEDFYITSMKLSPLKEVCTQYRGVYTYIVTLNTIYIEDDGTEKPMKYKILLWANNLTEANHNAQELARQGYDMHIESIKEVDYQYIIEEENGD